LEFTLYYRGALKSNRGASDKHALRRHFHPQLAALFQQPPLASIRGTILDHEQPDQSANIVQRIGDFRFAPLICNKLSLVAELSITLLRPEPPGALVQSGDIDNRLKTLLDGLKMPRPASSLPADAKPELGEDPFFCLLEDDSLITSLAVSTDRLLEPVDSPNEAVVLVRTRIRAVRALMITIGIGS
jgi:hypothetical protein